MTAKFSTGLSSVKVASCPGCGATLQFKSASSLVVVCEHCRAIVARTELKVHEVGKVAAIALSDSPLRLELTGRYNHKSFRIAGHIQLRHAMGGSWDEWYVAFSDGRWGWLAEAQGRFYLTFEKPLPAEPPPFDQLKLGHTLQSRDGALQVTETGMAEYSGADGELPIRIQSGHSYLYADLSGPEGQFGTLSYATTPPTLYHGREITLQELGLSETDLKSISGRRKEVASAKLSCPKCGGAVELRAPDITERVVCQYCNSMLDVKGSSLEYLDKLEQFKKPLIEIGKSGDLDGHFYTVIGYLRRSTEIDGETWYWEEYLLYNVGVGYRWLVFSDDQWLFVAPVPAGEITQRNQNSALYKGRGYLCMQRSTGRVEQVLGEFYWKVEVGEEVEMADFQSGGFKLSREAAAHADGTGAEVNWSHGSMISRQKLQKAFGLRYSEISTGASNPADIAAVIIVLVIICAVVGVIWYAAEETGSGGSYSFRGGSSFGGFGGGK